MGFGFTHRQDVTRQVRRMAAEQLDKAIEEASGSEFDEAVHTVRRRCKRLRGLLRLVRPNFSHYDRENAALREAANSLSAVRDAAAIIQTFAALRKFDTKDGHTARLDPKFAAAVQSLLEERARAIGAETDGTTLLTEFRDALAQIRDRAEHWSLDHKGFAAIETGLEATYGRMRKRLDKARKDGSAAAFHDWRKDTKYHWHHVGLLQDAAPDVLGQRKELLNHLGEYLGDHHNLFVLGEVLQTEPEPITAGEMETLRGLIAEQQQDLADKALALGEQLTAEAPRALGARFEAYWKLLPEVN
jgi:CHAD domain-containing protein